MGHLLQINSSLRDTDLILPRIYLKETFDLYKADYSSYVLKCNVEGTSENSL